MQQTQRATVAFAVLALVLAMSPGAQGHGWLMDPVPRSGGGTGSGNAATASPCGRAGPETVVAEIEASQPFTITYKRANNHGNSGPNVEVRLSYVTASPPVNSDFDDSSDDVETLTTTAQMDTTTSQPQTATLTAPARTGAAVLQWKWQPRNGNNNAGSPWFDCAFVEIVSTAAPACVTPVNGGCDTNAQCTGDSTPVCKCKVGYFGNGKTCEELPDDTPIELTVFGDTSDVSQDSFTDAIADLLDIDAGRVLFDSVESGGTMTIVDEDGESTTRQISIVTFHIGANPETGESGDERAARFERLVGQDSSSLSALGVPVARVEVANNNPVDVGSTPASSSGVPSSAANFGMAFGIGFAFVGAAVGAVLYRKKRSEEKNSAASATDTYTPQYMVQPSQSSGQSQPPPLEPAVDYSQWVECPGEDGGPPYFYNQVTGESAWTLP